MSNEMTNGDQIKAICHVFTHAKQSICFAVQFEQAVYEGDIKPEYIKVSEIIPDAFFQKDWTSDLPLFKEMLSGMCMSVVSLAVIMCSESYFDFIYKSRVKGQDVDPDMHSAEMILRLVRNSMGHVSVQSVSQVQVVWNVKNSDYRKLYEIKEIGVALDARELDGKIFQFQDLGGLGSFFKVLCFLEKGLRAKN